MELFTPDFGLVFWMFVAFGILFLVLWKYAWPIILKTVDSRADLIDKGVEYAQNAKEQLDNARSQAEEYLNETRRQQADILRDADRMKSQIIESARSEAKAAAAKEMENAKLQIQQQQKEAQQQFRNQVSEFALQIAGKIVQNEIKDDAAQNKLVNNLLDQIENDK